MATPTSSSSSSPSPKPFPSSTNNTTSTKNGTTTHPSSSQKENITSAKTTKHGIPSNFSSLKNQPMLQEVLKYVNVALVTGKAIDSYSIILLGNISFIFLSIIIYYLVGSAISYRFGVLGLLTANATFFIHQLRSMASNSTSASSSSSVMTLITNLIFKDSNSPYLFLSFLMLFLKPLPFLIILALGTLSVIRVVESAQKAQPSSPFPAWKNSQIWKDFGPPTIQKILPHKGNILEVQCQLELLSIPQSLISIITSSSSLSSILLPIILLSLLRWNFIISPRHRLAIKTLDSQIMLLVSSPSAPPVLLSYYMKIKKFISSTTPLSTSTSSSIPGMKR